MPVPAFGNACGWIPRAGMRLRLHEPALRLGVLEHVWLHKVGGAWLFAHRRYEGEYRAASVRAATWRLRG